MTTSATEAEWERFWSKVDRGDGCWTWTGQLGGRPPLLYGVFKWRGKNRRAHRWLWEQVMGSLALDVYVCHSCDNPPCVRPDHLWIGSNGDNVRDSMTKGRFLQLWPAGWSHGTRAGYASHGCRCEECRKAQHAYSSARWQGLVKRRPPAPCGTPAAYARHRRRGEEPDEACRAAKAEAERERYWGRKASPAV